MNKPSILFLFFLISINLAAQQKVVLAEDFSSNKNYWAVGKIENLSAKIEDGKFIIDNNLQTAFHPQLLAGVDSSKGFEISISIKTETQNLPGFSGLIFGSNMYRKFCFAINANGEYALFEMYNNDYRIIIPETKTPHLKMEKNETNRLKLSKAGKEWKLYINDSLVNSIPSQKFYGPYIGLYIEKMKAEFDDLKVTGTPVETSGNLCALFPLIFQSAKNNFEYIKGAPANKDDTTRFYLSIILKEDRYARVYYGKYSNDFFSLLKSNTTKAAAIKYTDSLILQMKKCQPGYTFTKTINKEGLPEYKITEKVKSAVKQPETKIEILASSGFSTIVTIYADPVKSNEQWAVAAKPGKTITASKKEANSGWIVNENFSNNDNNWFTDSTALDEFEIKDNRYIITHKKETSTSISQSFSLDEIHDYKIESVINNFTGQTNNAFGLALGMDGKKGLFFLATNDGHFRIDEETETGLTMIKDFTFSNAIRAADKNINLGKENKFTLIKLKDTWSFRINDREVYTCKARPFNGKKFGFYIPPKSSLFINSFKIYDWTLAEKFPDQPKEVIYTNTFYDDFQKKKYEWEETDDADTKSTFLFLDYRIQRKKSDGFFMPCLKMLASNKIDFRIELSASHTDGAMDQPYGMCFSGNNVDNAFVFMIANDGTFAIGKFVDGKYVGIKDWTETDAIHKNNYATNALLVEKIKGVCKFYINKKLVHTLTPDSFFDKLESRFGPYVEGKQTVAFTSMSVDKIEYR